MGRFQNVNLEKEGSTVRGPSDVKSEIKILTVTDDHCELWEEFLLKHSSGDLINLMTWEPYNCTKGFRKKGFSLQHEFFKHLGHFIDKDLKVYVQHLLGKTPNRTLSYPKVSVYKAKSVVVSNYCGADS